MDTSSYRKLIVGINTKVPLINGNYSQIINLDNAATTPAFTTVIEQVTKFLSLYSSVHRGFGYKSQLSTKVYEDSRTIVANFVGADPKFNSVIFLKNTTEAINKLSNLIYSKYKDNVILSTDMEHHSNDLPWRKYTIDYISVDKKGILSLEDLEKKLRFYKGKVKLVTITGASNVTGYKNSIHEAAKISHRYDAKILIDGAQLVPHCPVNMKPVHSPEHIDYLVFSAHKLYAPFGIGVLIGPKKDFNNVPPDYPGGGNVDIVNHNFVTWDDTPKKDESGSPNVIGVVALITAIKTLSLIGLENIESHESDLIDYTLEALLKIPHLKIYFDPKNKKNHIGVISFNIDGLNHKTVAKILSYESGISVRNGCFCAQPYVQKLLKLTDEEVQDKIKTENDKPGMVRISLGLYNTKKEIDVLINALEKIAFNRKYYFEKYTFIPDEIYFRY